MKKRLLSLTLVMAMIFTQISFISVFAETTADTSTQTPIESAFTDANFLEAVREVIGKTNDEHIYPSDVENITELDVGELDIISLAGIEYFTGLQELYCYVNDLIDLDLSNNNKLEVVDCSYNTHLTSLNVSNCPELQILECNYANLSKLDITNNPKLTRLYCFSNSLHNLDIGHNPLLEDLDAKSMGLTIIDMSQNPKLKKVNIAQNYITEDRVILPENSNLNWGTTLRYSPQKTNNDISRTFSDPKLLECVRESIDKPTGNIYQSDVEKITTLNVENEKLTSLDGIEHLKALETLNCASNNLTDLDVSSNLELQTVRCYRNDITSLDLTSNTELKEINAYKNKLEDIDISKNNQLETVNVSYNKLDSINISASEKLDTVDISKNNILSDEKISLSTKYDVDIMAQADNTGKKVITTNEAKVKVQPQLKHYVFMEPSVIDYTHADVTISAAPLSQIKVFDITDCEGADAYADKAKPFSKVSDDKDYEDNINNLKKDSIPQTLVTQHVPDPADPDNLFNMNYTGKLTVSGERQVYKLLVVSYKAESVGDNGQPLPNTRWLADGAQVRVVEFTPSIPQVEKFMINTGHPGHTNNFKDEDYGKNGKGDVFDVLNSGSMPRINFFGYKFYVYLEIKNHEPFEQISIEMTRNDKNSYIQGKRVDLTYAGNDIFVGTGDIVHAGEWNDGGKDREGEIRIFGIERGDTSKTEKNIKICPARLIIDPSGYIYEGVPTNRLQDVKTTVYYMGRNGEAVMWNASEEDQTNPIFTDKRGTFEWAVPAGMWQVKAEKEGYETYYTGWLPVPPAQMDVNFSMKSTAEPEITQIVAYPDGIEIQFNKYMRIEDMTPENINITLDGENIVESIDLMDKEQGLWVSEHDENIKGGTEDYFVSRININPSTTLIKDENIHISINKNVHTYAGIAMTENYENDSVVGKRAIGMSLYEDTVESGKPPQAIEADKRYSVTVGTEQKIRVKITPIDSSIDKKLYLATDNDWAVSLPNYVTVDKDGWAEITVTPKLPLDVKVSMYLEGGGMEKEIEMSVVSE